MLTGNGILVVKLRPDFSGRVVEGRLRSLPEEVRRELGGKGGRGDRDRRGPRRSSIAFTSSKGDLFGHAWTPHPDRPEERPELYQKMLTHTREELRKFFQHITSAGLGDVRP